MKGARESINNIVTTVKEDGTSLKSIRCIDVGCDFILRHFSSDLYIDAMMTIVVAKGSLELEINRCGITAGAGSVVIVSPAHLFRAVECTPNMRCIVLLVGEEFMSETDSVDMIYKRIRYGVKLFDRPVVRLSAERMMIVCDRLRELQRAIDNSAHLYYREVVLNRLYGFYLDLSDTIDRSESRPDSELSARYESIVKRFIELLTANYRTEHNVGFYASQLNLSSHYLTLIVKETTGRSVSDFIFGMLYSDARALLLESSLSVQEITSLLNFSDQSAFGKFFKRHSGLSPLAFRKRG